MCIMAVLICLLNTILKKGFTDTLPLQLGHFLFPFSRNVFREYCCTLIRIQHTFTALLKAEEEIDQHQLFSHHLNCHYSSLTTTVSVKLQTHNWCNWQHHFIKTIAYCVSKSCFFPPLQCSWCQELHQPTTLLASKRSFESSICISHQRCIIMTAHCWCQDISWPTTWNDAQEFPA